MEAATKVRIFERDGWVCRYCARPVRRAGERVPRQQWATVDHMLPKVRGGSNKQDNLTTACLPCNTRKKNRTASEYVAWWLERTESEETRL